MRGPTRPALLVGRPAFPIPAESLGHDSPALHRGHGQALVPGDRLLRRPDGIPRRTDAADLAQAPADRRRRRGFALRRRVGRGLEAGRPGHRHQHHAASATAGASDGDFLAGAQTEERRITGLVAPRLHRRICRRGSIGRSPSPTSPRGTSGPRSLTSRATSWSSRPIPTGSAATPCTTATRPARSATPSSATWASEDEKGRYSIHFHLVGETMRGSSVIGASIWDSHNRWITIHGTDALVVRDNVGYKSVGHGYLPRERHRGQQRPRPQPGGAGPARQAAEGPGSPLRPQPRGRLLVGEQPEQLHAERGRRVRRVRLPVRLQEDERPTTRSGRSASPTAR